MEDQDANSTVIDFYLRKQCGSMTIRELAESTGKSSSWVYRRLKKLGLESSGGQRGKGETKPRSRAKKKAEGPEDADDMRTRLVELRDLLHAQLIDASSANIARVSAEYRAVLDAIKAIDEPKEKDEADAFGFSGFLSHDGW